ncbi:MAG TPA: MFS transporter, partial [Candidatus Caenarcaniphilales bacterium]|nr:MFS transporter [Candidatus Caenarcaniphilales bacterium]
MSGNPRALLLLAWMAGFTLIDSSIVSLALPDIARDFDRPVGELAWVATGFLLALAASLLAAGRLSDRFSARWVMAGGSIAFGITTLACGLAPKFELLIAARVAQGVAGGILYTVSLAIAATAFPPERRATAISIYFTSGALGAVIGPVVGGWLTDLGGWRLVFLAQIPLPLLVLALTLAYLPRVVGARQRFDVPGVLAASLFIAAATFAMLQVPVPGGALSAVVAGAVAVTALVAFVIVERRSAAPAVRLSIFRNSRFVVSTVAGAGAWFAIMSSVVYVALYLQLGRGFDATDAGLLLLAAPAVALVFFPFGGAAVGR